MTTIAHHMRVIEHKNFHTFRERAFPLLLQRECENCVMIGIIERLIQGKPVTRSGEPTIPLLLTIEDDAGAVRAVALQTSPHALQISPDLDDPAAEALARELQYRGWVDDEALGVRAIAQTFARRWQAVRRCEVTVHRQLRAFQCERVIDPPHVAGELRATTMSDLGFMMGWAAAFARDVGEPIADPAAGASRAIEEGRLHLWIDPAHGEPRAMCAWAGPTVNGVRINQVYTPPEFRRQGYASNATAELSRRLFASGKRFVFLFTDAANPVSNSVYQNIGYRHISDFEHLKFL